MPAAKARVRPAAHCPACGYPSLIMDVYGDGVMRCDRATCPRPSAAHEILNDPEVDHIVELRERSFTVRHPLIERLDDALMRCELHAYIASLPRAPQPVGRYRVTQTADGRIRSWEALNG